MTSDDDEVHIGETPSLLHTDSTNVQEKADELTAQDEEILKRLYAPPSTTSASVVKLGKTVSTGSRKGKGN
jgi:hypothetical protein